jgi:nicotinamidase-related amidase
VARTLERVHLVVIDGQYDFMDEKDSALRVAGATADAKRLARMVRRLKDKINFVQGTFDSHHPNDLADPTQWRDPAGKMPPPFTAIKSDDILAGRWVHVDQHARPKALDGLTIKEYFIRYCAALEAAGQYLMMIWPRHCQIGSPGHNIQPDLFAALTEWETWHSSRLINWRVKGENRWVEHYGALFAEVILPSDPSTGLDAQFLEASRVADKVAFAGWALSHCLKRTVEQYADNIGDEHLGKFYIVADASSPVTGFEQQGQAFLDEMVARGMHLTTTDTFLA